MNWLESRLAVSMINGAGGIGQKQDVAASERPPERVTAQCMSNKCNNHHIVSWRKLDCDSENSGQTLARGNMAPTPNK